MSEDENYNQNQYSQMLYSLTAFENGQTSLQVLVSELEALHGTLRNVHQKWSQAFVEEWSILEQVLAMAYDREATILNNQDVQFVHEAIANLRDLLLYRRETMKTK